MKTTALIICFLLCKTCLAQSDFNAAYSTARSAYKEKNHSLFFESIAKARILHPYHQGALYYSGVAAALNSDPDNAVKFLKQSILIDSRYDLTNPDLTSLTGRPDFTALLDIQASMNKSVMNSDTALVIHDRQLHAEGIAYNPVSHTFYAGSIHKRKVIFRTLASDWSDFFKEKQSEMTSVFGLKVDNTGKFLWICTSPMKEMVDYDSTKRSKVFKCDITKREVIASYEVPADFNNSVFGDLIIDKNNNVFVSDSYNNIVFNVNEKSKKLDVYYKSPEFSNIQGIVFNSDDSKLFIADYIKGIFALDIKSRKLSVVTGNPDISLKGIDGLLFYKNHLLTIQNGVYPMRSVCLKLDKNQTSVSEFTYIDRAHSAFNEPTLGVLDGDTLYYIANSQWGGYEKNGSIRPSTELQDIIILKNDLKSILKR